MKKLRDKHSKVGLMKFLKDTEFFEDIQEYHGQDEGEIKWLTITAILKAVFYSLK